MTLSLPAPPRCVCPVAQRFLFTSPFWDTAQLAVGKMSSKQRVKRFPLSKVKQLKAVKLCSRYFAFRIRKL